MAVIQLHGDLLPAHLSPSAHVFSLRERGLKRPGLSNTETKIIIFGKRSLILMWMLLFDSSNRSTEGTHLWSTYLEPGTVLGTCGKRVKERQI